MLEQILIAFDQLVNTFFGGMADETLSARAWRIRESQPFWHKLIDKLFFWQDEHCKTAFESEINRKQLPKEYRNL